MLYRCLVRLLLSMLNMVCCVIYAGFWPPVLPSSERPLFTDCGGELLTACLADVRLLHSPGRTGLTRTYESCHLQTAYTGLLDVQKLSGISTGTR